MSVVNNKLCFNGLNAEVLVQEFGSPLYVYEAEVLRERFRAFQAAFSEQVHLHYAMKANSNPTLLRLLQQEGAWIDAVAPLEVRLALDAGFAPERILFTGNNSASDELDYCIAKGVPVNLGSLEALRRYGERYPGTEASVRVNPGMGAGHHSHCITGGPASKFGIYHDRVDTALEVATKNRIRIIGVHSHIGTDIYTPEPMLAAMELVLQASEGFPELRFIDFGGGFGIPHHPEQTPLDLPELGRQMQERFAKFCTEYGRTLTMKLEPGRFIVGPAGTLLVTATNFTDTPDYRFVGVDSGFNHLVRPTMYGSYHHILNASRSSGPEQEVVIVGNICESGDVFSRSEEGMTRKIPEVRVGDCLALCDAGAYGMSMSSQYNTRPRPAEVLVENGQARLIRRRETYADLIAAYDRTEP
jgi:diaminopimelate decarboxylase